MKELKLKNITEAGLDAGVGNSFKYYRFVVRDDEGAGASIYKLTNSHYKHEFDDATRFNCEARYVNDLDGYNNAYHQGDAMTKELFKIYGLKLDGELTYNDTSHEAVVSIAENPSVEKSEHYNYGTQNGTLHFDDVFGNCYSAIW